MCVQKAIHSRQQQQTIVFAITNWCLTWNISLPEYMFWSVMKQELCIHYGSKMTNIGIWEKISTLMNHVR